jgi:hypothetical protein
MTNNEELIEFYEELRDAVLRQAEHLADYLIENNPEDYVIGKSDCGYYNNGVGFVTIDEQDEFDEDKALIDAYERMAQDINNGGDDLELYYNFFVENDRLKSALAKLILRIGGV